MQRARILAGTTLALALAVPLSALAQDPKGSPDSRGARPSPRELGRCRKLGTASKRHALSICSVHRSLNSRSPGSAW